MSKILAIKGDRKRGNEIIALLEMLGGDNRWKASGNIEKVYYSISNGVILYGPQIVKDTVIFTLDKFYKKYPYKVGDIVKTGKDEEGVIKQMRWVDNDIVYWVNSHKTCDWTQTLSVDVLDKYNRLNLNDIEYSMETKIESTGFMQLGKTFAVIFNDANYEDEVELQLGDYEIEVRDGKTYAVKKKPKYPTTHEECCEVIGISQHDVEIDLPQPYQQKIFNLFKLRICRDAYWKIAGEEMGLNKPWEPDWKSGEQKKYCIYCGAGIIQKGSWCNHNSILAFPTEEMRDVFHDNFKDLIEQCKEML